MTTRISEDGTPVGSANGDERAGSGTPNPGFADLFDAIIANVAQVLHGKRDAIELAVICLLAEGHLLIEDVPGVGKTSLAKALAASIDCSWKRVQFTPDLLPTDLVGVSIYQRSTESFRFEPGPLFANIVLADEINRASPKTQSALLEAMEERQVTVDGVSRELDPPFMVIATQNPVDQEGTYRLPESQLDRFLLRISIGYPSRSAEIEMLDNQGSAAALRNLTPVVSAEEIRAMIAAVSGVYVAAALKSYLVDLAEASRRHPGSRDRIVAAGHSPTLRRRPWACRRSRKELRDPRRREDRRGRGTQPSRRRSLRPRFEPLADRCRSGGLRLRPGSGGPMSRRLIG